MQPGAARDAADVGADASISRPWRTTKLVQRGAVPGHAFDPLGIELETAIVAQERLAPDLAALGQTQELALEAVQAPVDLVQLLDQVLDPVRVEVDLIDQIDHLLARLLVTQIELAIDRLVVLQAGQPLLLQGRSRS